MTLKSNQPEPNRKSQGSKIISAIKIERLDHVVLSVQSIEKMLPFYCDVLGFGLTQQNEDGKIPNCVRETPL